MLKGGEANAIAIRIARAAAKEKVAICGYHGWHDWYLSANGDDSGLDGHLLEKLEPKGVPQSLEEQLFLSAIMILMAYKGLSKNMKLA